MNNRIIRYSLAVALTFLLSAFATWGDFSWVTLVGPLTLEPDLSNMEAPGYIASPALKAVISRLFFLLVCFFFCMIPNLAAGLRQHARHLLDLAASLYVFFSWLSGSLTLFASDAPGIATMRIAALVLYFIVLAVGYDPVSKQFRIPVLLFMPGFSIPLAAVAVAVSLLVSLLFDGTSWLFNGQTYFVLLRLAILLTALAGAAAVHSRRRGI